MENATFITKEFQLLFRKCYALLEWLYFSIPIFLELYLDKSYA
jgi:hypothetical protein